MEQFKETFSKIKFRASWGLTGNDQLDGRRFAFLPTIDTDGSYKWGVNNDYNRSSRFEGEFGYRQTPPATDIHPAIYQAA